MRSRTSVSEPASRLDWRFIVLVWLLLGTAVTPSSARTLTIEIGLANSRVPPTFSLKMAGRDARPIHISVFNIEQRKAECEMALPPTELRSPAVGSWTYGQSIAGFSRVGCDPLGPGKYLLDVFGGGGVGHVKFAVSDGAARIN
jgi:hypothetical protein